MSRFLAIAALSAFGFTLAPAVVTAGPTGYTLGNGGTTLHRFDVASPGGASSVSLSYMGSGISLHDIDFRPLTGALYGYDDVSNAYYTVDVATGVLALASSPGVAPTGTDKLGIDFNPMIDRLRTVTELGENIVFNPNAGGTTVATDLFYGPGDPNSGTMPQVVANAYTNNVLGGFALSTQQYVLDSNLNVLATLANNAGTLATIGQITLNGSLLDFGPDAGFDVYTGLGGVNTAYAVLNVGNIASLYSIDLTSAAATLVGDLPGGFGTIRGLAIDPTVVPEPSSMIMAAIAAVGLVGSRIVRARARS